MRFGVALGSLASLLACGGEPHPTFVPPDPSGVSIERLKGATEAAFCELAFRCRVADGDLLGLRLLFRDSSACTSYAGRVRDVDLEDLVRAVGAGRVDYDGLKMAACLTRFKLDCSYLMAGIDDPRFLLSFCAEAFSGKTVIGGECFRSEECVPAAWCNTSSSAGTCPAHCEARTPLGGACSSHAQCESAGHNGWVRCSPAAFEETCAEIVRGSRPSAPSEPCGLGPTLHGTRTATTCLGDNWCNVPLGRGTCQAPLPANAQCRSNQDVCADASVCVPNGGLMTCRALELQASEAGACNPAQLQVCDPTAGLECTGGSCVRVTGDGNEGSICRPGDFQPPCNAGLQCQDSGMGLGGTCRPVIEDGRSCQNDLSCASGACEGGMCVSRSCI